MPDSLGIGRAFVRTLPCLLEAIDGEVSQSRLRQMMRHQLRLCLGCVGELLSAGIGDTAMQLLASPPQQARIGRVLQQGVFEYVRGIRRLAMAKDQPRARELLESRLQREAGHRSDGLEQSICELSTDCSAD